MESSGNSKEIVNEDLVAMLRVARLEAERAGSSGPTVRPLPASQLEAPIEILEDLGDQDIPPPAIAGFKISREIGTGGQATVFQATQNSTGQRVAIKVMPGGPLVGARRRERFDREARILCALTHPNVVGIIDRGTTADGSLFLVMDYIDGRQLDEYAIAVRADAFPHATVRLLQIFIKICEAVADAHAKGIVHRDLKPSNVRVDQGGEPHVLDFGLARVLGPEPNSETLTLTGQVLGSLPWASPEQVSGGANDIDARSDVYSLGVMLYQLLTGHFPYSVSGPIPQVADNILRALPKPPTHVIDPAPDGVNRELDTIVLKALAKIPDARFATAGELGREIEGWLTNKPQTPIQNPARRQRISRGAIGALVCIIAASGIVWVVHKVASGTTPRQSTSNERSTIDDPRQDQASSGMMNSLGMPSLQIPNSAIKATNSSIVTNTIGIRLAYISSGRFLMGSPPTESLRNPDENQHTVFITKPFYMGVTTVTRDQYKAVTGSIPGDEAAGDVPVTYVSWHDAHQFCEKLAQIDHHVYRLPTEAEWEYACRAGTTTMIGGTGRLEDMGWSEFAARSPMPVGGKQPNAWGLFDMHGNVSQWCEDHYQNKYPLDPDTDPLYRVESSFVVTRGGDYSVDLKSCRSAHRSPRRPDMQLRVIGFRVVMEFAEPPVHKSANEAQ